MAFDPTAYARQQMPTTQVATEAPDMFARLQSAAMRQPVAAATAAQPRSITSAELELMKMQQQQAGRDRIATMALGVQDLLASPEWQLSSSMRKEELMNQIRPQIEAQIQTQFMSEPEQQLAARQAVLAPLDQAFADYQKESGLLQASTLLEPVGGLARAVGDIAAVAVGYGGRAAAAITGIDEFQNASEDAERTIVNFTEHVRDSLRAGSGAATDYDRMIGELEAQGVDTPELALLARGKISSIVHMTLDNLPQILPIMKIARLSRGVAVLGNLSEGARVGVAVGAVSGAMARADAIQSFDRLSPQEIEKSPVYQELLQETGDPRQAYSRMRNIMGDTAAATSALVNGTIGSYGERWLLGAQIDKIGLPLWRRTMPQLATTIASEGITETLEEAGAILGESMVRVDTMPGTSVVQRLTRAGTAGAVAGAGLGALGAGSAVVRQSARENAQLNQWMQEDPQGQLIAQRIAEAPEADKPALREAAISVYNAQLSGEYLPIEIGNLRDIAIEEGAVGVTEADAAIAEAAELAGAEDVFAQLAQESEFEQDRTFDWTKPATSASIEVTARRAVENAALQTPSMELAATYQQRLAELIQPTGMPSIVRNKALEVFKRATEAVRSNIDSSVLGTEEAQNIDREFAKVISTIDEALKAPTITPVPVAPQPTEAPTPEVPDVFARPAAPVVEIGTYTEQASGILADTTRPLIDKYSDLRRLNTELDTAIASSTSETDIALLRELQQYINDAFNVLSSPISSEQRQADLAQVSQRISSAQLGQRAVAAQAARGAVPEAPAAEQLQQIEQAQASAEQAQASAEAAQAAAEQARDEARAEREQMQQERVAAPLDLFRATMAPAEAGADIAAIYRDRLRDLENWTDPETALAELDRLRMEVQSTKETYAGVPAVQDMLSTISEDATNLRPYILSDLRESTAVEQQQFLENRFTAIQREAASFQEASPALDNLLAEIRAARESVLTNERQANLLDRLENEVQLYRNSLEQREVGAILPEAAPEDAFAAMRQAGDDLAIQTMDAITESLNEFTAATSGSPEQRVALDRFRELRNTLRNILDSNVIATESIVTDARTFLDTTSYMDVGAPPTVIPSPKPAPELGAARVVTEAPAPAITPAPPTAPIQPTSAVRSRMRRGLNRLAEDFIRWARELNTVSRDSAARIARARNIIQSRVNPVINTLRGWEPNILDGQELIINNLEAARTELEGFIQNPVSRINGEEARGNRIETGFVMPTERTIREFRSSRPVGYRETVEPVEAGPPAVGLEGGPGGLETVAPVSEADVIARLGEQELPAPAEIEGYARDLTAERIAAERGAIGAGRGELIAPGIPGETIGGRGPAYPAGRRANYGTTEAETGAISNWFNKLEGAIQPTGPRVTRVANAISSVLNSGIIDPIYNINTVADFLNQTDIKTFVPMPRGAATIGTFSFVPQLNSISNPEISINKKRAAKERSKTLEHELVHALTYMSVNSAPMVAIKNLYSTMTGISPTAETEVSWWNDNRYGPNNSLVQNFIDTQIRVNRSAALKAQQLLDSARYLSNPQELLAHGYHSPEHVLNELDNIQGQLRDVLQNNSINLWSPAEFYKAPEVSGLLDALRNNLSIEDTINEHRAEAVYAENLPPVIETSGTRSNLGPASRDVAERGDVERVDETEVVEYNFRETGVEPETGETDQYGRRLIDIENLLDNTSTDLMLLQAHSEQAAGKRVVLERRLPQPESPEDILAAINDTIEVGTESEAGDRRPFQPDETSVAEEFLYENQLKKTQEQMARGDAYSHTFTPDVHAPAQTMAWYNNVGSRTRQLFLDTAAPFMDWIAQHGGALAGPLRDSFRLMKANANALQNEFTELVNVPYDNYIVDLMNKTKMDPKDLYAASGYWTNIRHALHEANGAHEESLNLQVAEAERAVEQLRAQRRVSPAKIRRAERAANKARRNLERYNTWFNAQPVNPEVFVAALEARIAEITAETPDTEAGIKSKERRLKGQQQELDRYLTSMEEGGRNVFESQADAEARAAGRIGNEVRVVKPVATAAGQNLWELNQRRAEILDTLSARLGNMEQAEASLNEGADILVRSSREILNRRLAAGLVSMDEFNEFNRFNYFVSLMTERAMNVSENESLDPTIYNVRKIDFARKGMLNPAQPASSVTLMLSNRAATEIGQNQFGQILNQLYDTNKAAGDTFGMQRVSMEVLTNELESENSDTRVGARQLLEAPGFIIARKLRDADGKEFIHRSKITFGYSTDPDVNATNKKLRDAMSTSPAMQHPYVEKVLKGAGNTTKIFGQLNTRFKAAFSPINMVKDLIERGVNILAADIYDASGNVVSGTQIAAKMMSLAANSELLGSYLKGQRNLADMGQYGGYWAEFKSPDLSLSYNSMLELVREKQFSGEHLQETNWFKGYDNVNKALQKAGKTANQAIDIVNKYNDYWNAYPAYLQYVAMRELGIPDGTAAAKTLDLFDLYQQGELTPFGQAMWPFFRSIVQGGFNMLRSMGLTPSTINPVGGWEGFFQGPQWRGRVALMAGTMVSYMIAGMMRGIDGDDEETGLNKMDLLSMDTISRGIPFPTGDGGYAIIPVGFGVAQMSHVSGFAIDRMQRGVLTPGEGFAHLTSTLFKNVAPSSMPEWSFEDNPSAWLFHAFTPAPLVPAFEFAMNKNYFGGTIYQEGVSIGIRDHEAGFLRTPEGWKRMAKTAYDISGGFIDVRPETFRHWMTQGLPGVLSQVSGFVTADDVSTNPNYKSTRDTLGPYLSMMGASSVYTRGPQAGAAAYFRAKEKLEAEFNRNGVRVTSPDTKPGEKNSLIRRNVLQAGLDPRLAEAYIQLLDAEKARTKLNTEFRKSSEKIRLMSNSVEALRAPYERYYEQSDAIYNKAVRGLVSTFPDLI